MALAVNDDRRAVISLMYEGVGRGVGVTEVVGKGELLDNISLRTGFTDLTSKVNRLAAGSRQQFGGRTEQLIKSPRVTHRIALCNNN